MKVLLRAQAYVADPKNHDEAIRLYSEFARQPVEITRAVWHLYTFDPRVDTGYWKDMKNYTDFLAVTGRIRNPVDPLEYTFTGYLAEMMPGQVAVRGKWNP